MQQSGHKSWPRLYQSIFSLIALIKVLFILLLLLLFQLIIWLVFIVLIWLLVLLPLVIALQCLTYLYEHKIYTYISIYNKINLQAAAVSLFESWSVQLRSNEDLEGPECPNYYWSSGCMYMVKYIAVGVYIYYTQE